MTSQFEQRFDHLSADIAAAAKEFSAWSQGQLLAEQADSTPGEPLYHYTGEAALKGILTHERIWCFRHLHQRDLTEFEYSLGMARRIIKEVGNSDDFFVHLFCACLADLLDNNSLTDTFEFYMFSLSRHRDDARQWSEYGHAGKGYAIGFSPSLFQPDRTELQQNATDNLFVGRVIYGDEATDNRHRLVFRRAAEITGRYAAAHRDAVRRVGAVRYVRSVALEVIASQLVWNCLTAKSEQYGNEREVRYLLLGLPGQFDEHRKAFDGKHYVEAALPLKKEGSIAEILVGRLAPNDAEKELQQFLDQQGYAAIPIRRSSAVPEAR